VTAAASARARARIHEQHRRVLAQVAGDRRRFAELDREGAQRLEIVDLLGEPAGLAGRERARAAVAALVVEDHRPVAPHPFPGAGVQVGVIEARTAVDQHQRPAGAAAGDLVPDRRPAGREGGAPRPRPRDTSGRHRDCGTGPGEPALPASSGYLKLIRALTP
jgi:hypothetical protein